MNEGVYATRTNTDQGATASESLDGITGIAQPKHMFVVTKSKVSPTFIDVAKPRTSKEFKGAITPSELGNFAQVTNVYNTPDISPAVSSETTPYNTISLRDTANCN